MKNSLSDVTMVIPHADEVDLRRMRFTRKAKKDCVSDVVEVYVGIVKDLKEMGH